MIGLDLGSRSATLYSMRSLRELFLTAYDRSGSPQLGDLAERAGVHRTTLSRWKSGDRQPDEAELGRVLDALGWDLAIVPREK